MRGLNPDPYLRDARGFIDTMMKDKPGYSRTLPPSRDVFGEPIARAIAITTATGKTDIVSEENNRIMLETGAGLHKPDPKFEGVDLRDITLASGQNAYDRYQELSSELPGQPPLKAVLGRLIKSKTYQNMPDGDPNVTGTKINTLTRMAVKYRKAAKKMLVAQNHDLQKLVNARQKEARGAIIANQKKQLQGDPSARALLDALSAR
jgi:hypothetical protein